MKVKDLELGELELLDSVITDYKSNGSLNGAITRRRKE